MSGGSYNYLCNRAPEELLNVKQDLQDMVNRLAGLDYAQDAAKDAQILLSLVNQFEERADVIQKRLYPVFGAVEWWDSNDVGEDDVKGALVEYRGSEIKPVFSLSSEIPDGSFGVGGE